MPRRGRLLLAVLAVVLLAFPAGALAAPRMESGAPEVPQQETQPENPTGTPVPETTEPPATEPPVSAATETPVSLPTDTPAPETPTAEAIAVSTETPQATATGTSTETALATASETATTVATAPSSPGGAVAPASVASGGDITSLTGTGAQPPSYCIQINSTLRAYEPINNSNLFYALILPGSPAWWRTTRYGVPSLDAGDTWSPPTWSVCNPPSAGTYTIFACWSPGNGSTNCNIDSAYTQFSSVPTLGAPLTLTALSLLGVFLWRRRRDFARDPS